MILLLIFTGAFLFAYLLNLLVEKFDKKGKVDKFINDVFGWNLKDKD